MKALRSFDCAPCGRFAQDDTVSRLRVRTSSSCAAGAGPPGPVCGRSPEIPRFAPDEGPLTGGTERRAQIGPFVRVLAHRRAERTLLNPG